MVNFTPRQKERKKVASGSVLWAEGSTDPPTVRPFCPRPPLASMLLSCARTEAVVKGLALNT